MNLLFLPVQAIFSCSTGRTGAAACRCTSCWRGGPRRGSVFVLADSFVRAASALGYPALASCRGAPRSSAPAGVPPSRNVPEGRVPTPLGRVLPVSRPLANASPFLSGAGGAPPNLRSSWLARLGFMAIGFPFSFRVVALDELQYVWHQTEQLGFVLCLELGLFFPAGNATDLGRDPGHRLG